jgi:predicted nucleotidyltransferase
VASGKRLGVMPPSDNDKRAEDYGGIVILEGFRGSQAHGTYIPSDDPNSIDDIDYMGIYVMPTGYYLGLDGYRHKHEVIESFIGNIDKVSYEIRKYVSLVSVCNPNVLSLLHNRPQDFNLMTPAGQMLIDNRDLFLSRRHIFEAFGGYARSQMRRMTHIKFEGYMGAKRKMLVEKYGYDCKNAGHCIRLLKLGAELLNTGTLKVFREHDRQLLMDIKTGKYPLAEVQLMAEKFFAELNKAYVDSGLPMENDKEAINELLVKIIRSVHD